MATVEISAAVRVLADSRLARRDLKTLVSLPEPKANQLLALLARDPELFAAPEPPFSKVEAAAKALEVDGETVWSLMRIAKWIFRNLEADADLIAVVEECANSDLLRREDAPRTATIFRQIKGTDKLRDTFSDRNELAAVMPTFWDVEFACDLRAANPAAGGDVKRFMPVAILRLRSDEDPQPFILQCTATDLDRLIEAMQNARELLDSINK
jgi:hypothetical protein